MFVRTAIWSHTGRYDRGGVQSGSHRFGDRHLVRVRFARRVLCRQDVPNTA